MNNYEKIEISPKDLRKIQLLELEMLSEFDRVCRLNDIKYIIGAGTMIGAVRHKGFVPWDDDVDIYMLREEYSKFQKVADQLNPDICYFQDHYSEPEYIWWHAKIRRTETTFVRTGQEHMKFRTGIGIDVTAMDDVPDSLLKAIFQNIECYFLRKILWSRVGAVTEKKALKRLWFRILSHISVDHAFKRLESYAKKSSSSSKNDVRILTTIVGGKYLRKKFFNKQKYGRPKKWYMDTDEYEFEGLMLYGPRDYDDFLTYSYGNYMKLPSKKYRRPRLSVSSYTLTEPTIKDPRPIKKLLILSDIHGNLAALKSVLNITDERSDISACIILGDIIDYGEHSNEVIDILRGISLPVICNISGNHENAVINDNFMRFSSERGVVSAQYTQSILSQSSWDYIKSDMQQSGKYVFTIGNKKCLAVHGSLSDEYWGCVSPDSAQDEYADYDCVFSGHSHIPHFFEKYIKTDDPKNRNKKKIIFINPGSVGQPRNLNNMAQYAVFDIETETVEICKAEYDIESEQLSFTGHTDPFYMERLEHGI